MLGHAVLVTRPRGLASIQLLTLPLSTGPGPNGIINHHVHDHVHDYYLRRRSLTSSWLRREEIACRFCSSVLPDWKPVLTPPLDDAAAACPTMSVTFNGQVNIKMHAHALAPDRPAEWTLSLWGVQAI